MIMRLLQSKIEKQMFRGRAVILYGARRVGKTTLAQQILINHAHLQTRYLNCDLLSVRRALSIQEAAPLRAFLGEQQLIVLDEAQNIEEIGRVLKILVDEFPHMQVLATGSSSFDLVNRTAEPLTGRMYRFVLYPFSLQELAGDQGYSQVEPQLDFLLRFGSYPTIFGKSEEEARVELDELVANYLYKDILIFAGIRKSTVLLKLLELLARQVGQEVSYQELAQILGIDRKTVMVYLDLLEQCFVIFRLGAFSRNLRKEIAKSVKIYFYDLGVRNTLIQNFAPLALRTDLCALWENFCLVERRKFLQYNQKFANPYFWRTQDQQEIDYLEEADGQLAGYEFKWSSTAKWKEPTAFLSAYPNSTVQRVDRSNYWQFLL